jgi:hypothetical protein
MTLCHRDAMAELCQCRGRIDAHIVHGEGGGHGARIRLDGAVAALAFSTRKIVPSRLLRNRERFVAETAQLAVTEMGHV